MTTTRRTAGIVVAALAALLGAGCASVEHASWHNRLTCAAGDRGGYVLSMWGLFGIATVLHPDDAKAACR